MIPRARYEGQIKRIDTWSGSELEDALTTLAFRIGLSWFTDEQIAEIRDEMIATEWRRNRRQMESREAYRAAALRARQSTETTHV